MHVRSQVSSGALRKSSSHNILYEVKATDESSGEQVGTAHRRLHECEGWAEFRLGIPRKVASHARHAEKDVNGWKEERNTDE